MNGVQADAESSSPAISASGRFVAFVSAATNLLPGTSQSRFAGYRQVYVYDRQTGGLTRESVDTDGIPGLSSSDTPVISESGRYVAFYSDADLVRVPQGTMGTSIYIRDRDAAVTTRPIKSWSGYEYQGAIALSGDGRTAAFRTYAYYPISKYALITVDRASGGLSRDDVAPDGTTATINSSAVPSFSADGRYLAFVGYTSASFDSALFVRDRVAGTTTIESISPTGSSVSSPNSPSLSADGRYVAFYSFSFTGVYIRDRLLRRTVAITTDSSVSNVKLSADVRYVSYLTNGRCEVYDTATSTYVSLGRASSCSAAAGGVIAFATDQPLVPEDTNGKSDMYVAQLEASLGAPTNLTNTVSGTRLTLTWTAPTGRTPSAYIIEAGSAPGARDVSVTTPTNATTFTATVPLGTTYYIRVRATDGTTSGDPSNEILVSTVADTPGTPGFIRTNVSGSIVVLTWTPPTTGGVPAGYRLEVGTVSGLADLGTFNVGNTLSYTEPRVPVGTYYVRVRAFNAAGAGPPSSTSTVFVR